jgi:hypothetical protein
MKSRLLGQKIPRLAREHQPGVLGFRAYPTVGPAAGRVVSAWLLPALTILRAADSDPPAHGSSVIGLQTAPQVRRGVSHRRHRSGRCRRVPRHLRRRGG